MKKDAKRKDDWVMKALTLSGTSLPSIQRNVGDLMREYELRYEGKDREYISYKVSSRLIKRSAIKSGGYGGIFAAPATLPWVGAFGTFVFSTTADIVLLIRAQVDLCYAISVAYGVEMEEEELKAVILALFGFSGSAGMFKTMTAKAMRDIIDEMAVVYMKKGIARASVEVADRMVPRILGRAFRFLPLIGIPLNASINIAAVMAVGNKARKYFSVWGKGYQK